MKQPAALSLALLLAISAGCSPSPTEQAPSEASTETTSPEAAAEAEPGEDGPEVVRHLNVLIYYPAANGNGLQGESHEIFNTTAPGDRAKQILADLLSGPTEEGALPALPSGTELRQVYVLGSGTAYVDFSADLERGLGGGSTEELNTVYAVINSVALNIPEIRRVGILIDGQPIDTLNGHLDLRRPLPPDPGFIRRR